MSRRIELDELRGQLAAINSLLSSLKPSNIAERRNLTGRRDALTREIEDLEHTPLSAASVSLLFEGEPVHGSYGIDSAFAGAAVTQYDALIQCLAGKRSARQQLERRLLLTDVIHGSCGVELAEAQDSIVPSQLAEAVEQASTIFSAATRDERDVRAAMGDAAPEAILAARRFMSTIGDHNASMRIVSSREDIHMTNKQISRAHDCLRSMSVGEKIERLTGIFGGVLPFRRTFDFKPDNDRAISGKLADTIVVDELIRLCKRPCHVTVRSAIKPGQSRSSGAYTLLDAHPI